MSEILGKNNNVLIATFSPWKGGKRLPTNGNVEPMLDFFIPRIRKTVLIDLVYPGSDFVIPIIEEYMSKRKSITRPSWWLYILKPFLTLTNTDGTHISFKLRDFLSVLDVGLKEKEQFDFFVGFESINAIAGIVLRKLGKVKKVIYYVSDYSPHRYSQAWFNSLYLWLDRYAATHVDFIWDVSPAMQPARVQAGLNPRSCAPILIVPNALYPAQIKTENEKKREPNSLVFMGTLGRENGPDLAIEALPYVLKKVPNVKLHIVGGGSENLSRLKNLTLALAVEQHVIFHGFVADREEVSKEIRKFMIALAPYIYFKGSARLFGDATKIRAYMAAGLPTITTKVPPLGKEVEKKGAAVIIDDTKEALASAIVTLLSDRTRWAKMVQKAISFARENTWENEYKKAFDAMFQFKA